MTDTDVADPLASQLEHRAPAGEFAAAAALTLDALDLAENALGAATALKKAQPGVVFTSGRRTVAEQADAMAGNIVANRQWIAQTYAASAERDALQAWVDTHPAATVRKDIAAGLSGILSGWSDAKRVRLSRHFAGLAFDVRPGDEAIKTAIKALPNLVKFLDGEGGLTIWHAEFSAK